MDELIWELSAPHSLDAIAEHLGVSRRTVARVEQRALAKMKHCVSEDWQSGLKDPNPLQTKLHELGPTDGRTRPLIRDANDK